MQYYTIQYLNIVPEDDVNLAVLSAVKTLLKNVLKSLIPSPPRSQTIVNRCFVSESSDSFFNTFFARALFCTVCVMYVCLCKRSQCFTPLCTVSFLNHVVNKMAAIFVAGGSNLIWAKTSCKYVSDSLFFLLIHCKFPSLSHTVAKKAD